MQWIQINTVDQIAEIKKKSEDNPVLIFKHSTRCSTSRMSLDRLERNWKTEEMSTVTPYFLDLISYREVSNRIAAEFGIQHESPQVIVVSNGKSILDLSHFEIDYEQIRQRIRN